MTFFYNRFSVCNPFLKAHVPDAALASLRAATSECAAAAGRFRPDQSAGTAALAAKLCALFPSPPTAAAGLHVERQAPLLPQLPAELIVEVLQHLDVRSLDRLACTCRPLYFGPPCPLRPMSLVETAIRRRADEVGRWTPSSLPAGVSKWVPYLLEREWRIGTEACTVAAGGSRSFFVDASGALLVCGKEGPGEIGLLGLREAPARLPSRRRCRQPCLPWREFAFGLWFASQIATSP
jgi:hypothetical protein